MMVGSIRFSVQATPRDRDSWTALARRAETGGLYALLVGDHPGTGPAPWTALGAAAAVTDELSLGTYVLQTGVRDPIQTASEAATLNLLAPGRVLLGLGAGHTFREWESTGLTRPSPADRAGRLVEFVGAVCGLLDGDTVTLEGRWIDVADVRLEGFPADDRVTVVVGGGHPRILELAAQRADVVALSGLGRTLPDGHQHEVRWSEDVLMSQLERVRRAADAAGRDPAREVLVQQVIETDDRSGAIHDLRQQFTGSSVADLAETPFLLIGTIDEMAAQVQRQAEQLGVTSYVVREAALATVEKLLPLIAAG